MKKLRAALRIEPGEFYAEAIEGELAEGNFPATSRLRRTTEGIKLKPRLGLRNVDARTFFALEGAPIGGRLGLQSM